MAEGYRLEEYRHLPGGNLRQSTVGQIALKDGAEKTMTWR